MTVTQEPRLLATRTPTATSCRTSTRSSSASSSTRRSAAAGPESGDVDLIATSDPSVVGRYVEIDRPVMLLQDAATPRRTTSCSTSPSRSSRTRRGALRARPGRSTGRTSSTSIFGGFAAAVANGPFSPGQDGYLEDAGLPRTTRTAAAAAIADVGGRERPAGDQLLDDADRHQQGDRRLPAAARGARSASTSPRRPIEQSKLITNALLGSPEFLAFGWRNHAGLYVDTQTRLVARLRRRRLRWRGHGRRRGAQLRPPQRPGDQRPARPGPLGPRTPPTRKALAEEINQEFAKRVLDPADCRGRRGASSWTHGPEHRPRPRCPTARATSLDGAGFPGQVWLDVGVHRRD